MTQPPAELFWPSLQQLLGGVVRHPLTRATGTLTSNLGTLAGDIERAYVSDERADCHERLAVYNRQYWFRLFSVMQQEFPLVAHLLGYWEFNGWASDFLDVSPPRSVDVAGIGDGFVDFVRTGAPRRLEGHTPSLALLLQAVDVDEAFRQIFRAPPVNAWQPDPSEAVRLAQASLRAAPNLAFVREDWPLVELRDAFAPDDEGPSAPFDALRHPNHWALRRTVSGMGRVLLEVAEYDLFVAIQTRPLHKALAELQSRTPIDELSALSSRVNQWLTRSMKLGFWVGVGEPES